MYNILPKIKAIAYQLFVTPVGFIYRKKNNSFTLSTTTCEMTVKLPLKINGATLSL